MAILDMSLEKLYEYRGISPLPEDFDEFWNSQLRELANLDIKLELKKADFESPIAECYDLYFNGIDGTRIYAKFMKPKEVKGKMPALLEFHGYEERSNDWSNNLHYVASGICVAVMECRGQDYLKEDSCKFKSFKSKGHIVRGLVEGREKLLF
ncbi:MAG: acetylxylan esterase, partial [Clostridium perfringens]|nr:acetylxylan esterase [Clostridium perfringens]